MPLPLMSSRLLKHRTTRSRNARFVCRAELFYSRCQAQVFLIHSLKRRFQLLCRKWNQRQPQATTTSMWNSWRSWAPSSHLAVQILLQNHGYHSTPKIWKNAKEVIAVEKPGKDQSLAANSTAQSHYWSFAGGHCWWTAGGQFTGDRWIFCTWLIKCQGGDSRWKTW